MFDRHALPSRHKTMRGQVRRFIWRARKTNHNVALVGRSSGLPQSLDTPGVSVVTRSDSLDWKGLSASEITRRVLDRVQPGSIVLFHNAAEHTPEALPEILDSLLSDGYRVVPVSQILVQGDCFIDSTGRQCRR